MRGSQVYNSHFYRHPNTSDGRLSCCKVCHCAAAKAYRAANPERWREISRRSKRKHRLSTISTDKLCVVCGVSFTTQPNNYDKAKYCGKSCRNAAHRPMKRAWQGRTRSSMSPELKAYLNARQRSRRRKRKVRECLCCGSEFEAMTVRARFCSVLCLERSRHRRDARSRHEFERRWGNTSAREKEIRRTLLDLKRWCRENRTTIKAIAKHAVSE